jgi:RNA polymerase sigma-70 factor (ECF subfamily)
VTVCPGSHILRVKRAWEAKDIRALVALLDPDATTVADGGGLVSAVARPVEGAERIARTYVEIADRTPGLTIQECVVNGQPGLVTQHHGATATVLAFDVAGGRITHIWAVRKSRQAPSLDHR